MCSWPRRSAAVDRGATSARSTRTSDGVSNGLVPHDDELKAEWAGATATSPPPPPQPLPVIRQMYWPALIPQAIAIGVLAFTLRICLRTLDPLAAVLVASLAYVIVCRVVRASLARDHVRGMKALRAGRFDEAIPHFESSYTFWCSHRTLDGWRSLYGIASYNPYRVMALLNAAFCCSQVGKRTKAIELYEQVLRESPNNTIATVSLRMLAR